MTFTFNIKGMSCDHCVAAIEKAVSMIPGIKSAKADLASGTLTVDSFLNPTELVTAAVKKLGFSINS